VSAKALLGGSACIRGGRPSAASLSQAAAAASMDPQAVPEDMRPELISGGDAPKSIFDNLRVPWLSGRFADIAADLAQ
jgi:hypothetical protein